MRRGGIMSSQVIRGGWWGSTGAWTRSAFYFRGVTRRVYDQGFRVVLVTDRPIPRPAGANTECDVSQKDKEQS